MSKNVAPEQPETATAEWTGENRLILHWKHPTVSNGPIKSFILKILKLGERAVITEVYNIKNISRNYTYAVSKAIKPNI